MKFSLLMHMNSKLFPRKRYLLAPPRRLSSLSNEKNMEMFFFRVRNVFITHCEEEDRVREKVVVRCYLVLKILLFLTRSEKENKFDVN